MERLQNALHRARERRGQAAPDGTATSGPSGPRTSASAGALAGRETVTEAEIDRRWAALKPFQPSPRDMKSNRIVSYFGKNNATPYDMMRTKMVQQAKTKGWKRIAIAAPTSRCGKTTTALNLAFSLSRQAEMRILVIEMDLRRPSMARYLGLNEPHYFTKVLAGLEPVEEHMVCISGNLAIATNVAAAANPSELLQSAKARDVLDELERTYRPDLMLFDTAPLLASDDTIGLMEYVDAALIVAAAEMSTIEEIDVAESEISEVAEVMGVVLNKCRYAGSGYGYEYGYY